MNYLEDLKIDESALDIEWLEQPELMFTYAKEAAEKMKLRDLAKEKVDFTYAVIEKDVRENPKNYDLEKTTEGAIRSAVLTSDDYTESVEEYHSAKYEYELAKGAVTAIDSRKIALENLVKLHGQSYFAGPKVPRDISQIRKSGKNKQSINRRIKMKKDE